MNYLTPILTIAALGSLVACFPAEPPPPPRFRPNPPFAPDPVFEDDPMAEPPVQQDRPAPAPPTANGGYPTATATADPEQVLSPYAPYNVIDVAGFKSGQLARDPSNKKIFRVP